MRPPDAIKDQITQLDDLMRAYGDAGAPEWSAGWMAIQGMAQQRIELQQELLLAAGVAELEVHLIGGAELRDAVEAAFLAGFLSNLQSAVDSIVHTFTHGETSRGPFPLDVTIAARLRVISAEAGGSMVVYLEGPERAVQPTLEGEIPLPAFDRALVGVLDLIAAASPRGDLDSAMLRSVGGRLGHRALTHMKVLASGMARTGTGLTMVHRSPHGLDPREGRLSATGAAMLQQALGRTRQVTETVHRVGRLSGIRWRNAVFDLEADDEFGQEVISGGLISELRDVVQGTFDSTVRAELERTVTSMELEDNQRISYRLIGISPA